MGVAACEESRESQAGRRREVFAFLSCLEVGERDLTKGATTAEELEVVGTCVYYYLPGPGHDARSRIEHHLCSVRRLFFRIWEGRQGVVQCWTGTSGMWALPRVWRRARGFIVQGALVGRPCTYLDHQQSDRRADASIQ